jgi:hypothetical protein
MTRCNLDIINNGYKHSKKGWYNFKNINKKMFFRSSWELKFMQYLDTQEFILKWNSEGVTIVYQDLTGATHKYYPDFYYECLNSDDPTLIDHVVVEIKPYSETIPPVKPKNPTIKALTNYEYACKTYIKNRLKWDQARLWCNKRGYKFIIITEQHLKRSKLL